MKINFISLSCHVRLQLIEKLPYICTSITLFSYCVLYEKIRGKNGHICFHSIFHYNKFWNLLREEICAKLITQIYLMYILLTANALFLLFATLENMDLQKIV